MGDGQTTNVFDMSVQMLDIQFTPKTNLILQRHKFFSRVQQKDEDIASYVASLRGLALSYEFDQLLDSRIRDQLVRCASDKRIREKLLKKDPNLEEAIQIAKRMEHAAVWLQEMDVNPKQVEQGIVAEIKKKEEPHSAMRWNRLHSHGPVLRGEWRSLPPLSQAELDHDCKVGERMGLAAVPHGWKSSG
ncbi:hypothetical protein NDU88_001469 [Pleurodeles waltl]|uniref:Retrotransposon gag domain-containing protein n=1 Tax=Pleurodeles waltl TaxID=8319 RepID=A0AAV7U7N5_PLEWA|nr:hypothetical protein NDU88_001469 [Pleurodeles waltl]